MPKVKLIGTLSMSTELFSRLQARGLLNSSEECSEDFIFYLQECLARDDSRVQGPGIIASVPNTIKSREAVASKVPTEPAQPVQKNLSIDQIRKRAETLYSAK